MQSYGRRQGFTSAYPSVLATISILALAFAALVALTAFARPGPASSRAPPAPRSLHAPPADTYSIFVVDSASRAAALRSAGFIRDDSDIRVVVDARSRDALTAELLEIDALRSAMGLPPVQLFEMR
jgi:hypothetical protein